MQLNTNLQWYCNIAERSFRRITDISVWMLFKKETSLQFGYGVVLCFDTQWCMTWCCLHSQCYDIMKHGTMISHMMMIYLVPWWFYFYLDIQCHDEGSIMMLQCYINPELQNLEILQKWSQWIWITKIAGDISMYGDLGACTVKGWIDGGILLSKVIGHPILNIMKK